LSGKVLHEETSNGVLIRWGRNLVGYRTRGVGTIAMRRLSLLGLSTPALIDLSEGAGSSGSFVV
jgi:hypothetical protein